MRCPPRADTGVADDRLCYRRSPMRLIVTEKNNSAQKIAEILSGGNATDAKSFTVPVFRWTDGDGEHAVLGTGGHAVERAFPEGKEYKQWKLD
jgi:DNA topoisomerase-1